MRPTDEEVKRIQEVTLPTPFSWYNRAMAYKDVIRAQNRALTRKNRRIKRLRAENELLVKLMGERAVKQVMLWKKKGVMK